MKKFLVAVAVFISTSAIAQTTTRVSKTTMFSIGAEALLPVGSLATTYGVGFGGSAQVEFKPDVDLGITLNAGYITYTKKSGAGTGTPSLAIIPVMAGAKYYFGSGLYGHGQLGAGFSRSKYDNVAAATSYTNFMYAAGIGYGISSSIDAELKYQGNSNKDNPSVPNTGNNASSSIALRLAYNF